MFQKNECLNKAVLSFLCALTELQGFAEERPTRSTAVLRSGWKHWGECSWPGLGVGRKPSAPKSCVPCCLGLQLNCTVGDWGLSRAHTVFSGEILVINDMEVTLFSFTMMRLRFESSGSFMLQALLRSEHPWVKGFEIRLSSALVTWAVNVKMKTRKQPMWGIESLQYNGIWG